MKKIIALFIVAVLCFAVAACENQIAPESSDAIDAGVVSESQTDALTDPNEDSDHQWQLSDLFGHWKLDLEKTDTNAIAAAWETFPGYTEWGSGMEICSDGSISWYIGAVGGSGTYCLEGDILHTMMSLQPQEEMPMDLLILDNNALQMTYAGIEITWAHGSSEDIPANGE